MISIMMVNSHDSTSAINAKRAVRFPEILVGINCDMESLIAIEDRNKIYPTW